MGGAFFVLFFFPLPTVLAAGAFKDSSHYRLAGLGFRRTILLCFVHAFRPEQCVEKPVSSPPGRRKQLGITPTLETSCWQAQGVTSDAFHTSPIGGPVLPFGKQDLLSGTCWQGQSDFPAKCTEEGGEVFTARFCGSPAELQLLRHAFPFVFISTSLNTWSPHSMEMIGESDSDVGIDF